MANLILVVRPVLFVPTGFHTPGSGSGVVAQRPATLWTVAYRMGDSFRGLWWTKALGKTEL